MMHNIPDPSRIHTYGQIRPTIYAYTTPGYPKNEGWVKIGYTQSQTAADRVRQQGQTIDVDTNLEWDEEARYRDGGYFDDHAFHAWLEYRKNVKRRPKKEWFFISPDASHEYFFEFADREAERESEKSSFILRREQQEAVDKTKGYFELGGEEFLWNAKPRFGKTLTSYALVQAMDLKKVLIVTNRPSISDSWLKDFFRFIGWQGQYSFVTDNEGLLRNEEWKRKGVLSRREFVDRTDIPKGMIAFESLQGLKTSLYFGGDTDKLKWIEELEFDLLIVDESHEGVSTRRTERAFDNIRRKHTLYLSGTPFRQLSSEDFAENQIFTWSYVDEQRAKENWEGEEANPYENLPRLNLFTYQLSPMVREKAEMGIDLTGDGTRSDYAFDLNEFFRTENEKFVYEDKVREFLKSLSRNEKYPFSTPELRNELSHTMWYLNRVPSAKALAKLLAEDEVFRDYKVVLAVGDARNEEMPGLTAFGQVKKAIRENPKTITLTVGQLTVGVTVPEWSVVLMLCNMKSAAAYMQAAFRAQNQSLITVNGKLYVKENAYIFDFDPARTLVMFDEFANDLVSGGARTSAKRADNIAELMNFLPVIGEDPDGKMVELDAESVLSIPGKLKSQEVVRCGFMSNLLFNVGHIFGGALDLVAEILNPVPVPKERAKKPKPIDTGNAPEFDDEGNPIIPQEVVIGADQEIFGDKVWLTKQMADVVNEAVSDAQKEEEKPSSRIDIIADNVSRYIKKSVTDDIISPIADARDLTKKTRQKLEKTAHKEIDRQIDKLRDDFHRSAKIAEAQYKTEERGASTPAEKEEARKRMEETLKLSEETFTGYLLDLSKDVAENGRKSILEEVEKARALEERTDIEDYMKAHLKGFARAIPSFIMAYGDENLRLGNLEDYVKDMNGNRDPKTFKEVSSISLEDFLFLRDGGDRINTKTGEMEHFSGNLFNETVFNDSVREFLRKKSELANYFDPSQEGDIFDYIPPQRTNQIFTPRWVVSMMVDKLEKENPGCFDNPDATFADLYMKSGLYITEIAKRLYRSAGLKKAFPDGGERILHILEKQLYGIAPTRIIYLIATNFIFGFDESLKEINHNFVEADTVSAAKAGNLQTLLDREFG